MAELTHAVRTWNIIHKSVNCVTLDTHIMHQSVGEADSDTGMTVLRTKSEKEIERARERDTKTEARTAATIAMHSYIPMRKQCKHINQFCFLRPHYAI